MKLDVSTRRDYIIATALTGPGISALNTLKAFITGEIRQACGVCGPPILDKPASVEGVRGEVLWLQRGMVAHRYLRQGVRHWLKHAHNALLELNCGDYWLRSFVYALYRLSAWPREKDRLDTLLGLLDEFTEEGSRIFG